MDTLPDAAVAGAFVDALARRDFDAIGDCFSPAARMRALVPQRLRDETGPGAIAERFRFWYADLGEFELVESEVDAIADRVRIRYRVRGVDPEDGAVVQEQEGYATVDDGRIAAMNLVCSGFRPAA